ncbi:MAG: DUF1571 domain-containing protein [Planctomycetota bacterium]
MRRNRNLVQSGNLALLLAAGVVTTALVQQAGAQQNGQFVEPIVRIDHEQPAGQPTQVASRIAVAKTQPPFDLTQLQGEHPLMPALRVARQSMETIDARVRDYNAIMMKQERINGELAPKEVAFIKVRHQPFGVYMYFLGGNKGRECLYNANPDGSKGDLVARDCGFRGKLGKFTLDPEGNLAMKGQKYPIMKLGIRELTKELITVASNDVKFGECDVTSGQGTMEGRAITWLKVVHPVPRPNFRFNIAQVFIDNELQVPVRYNAYTWPKNPGEEPQLEESYTYVNLKVNNGYTDMDFSPENPQYFK